VTFTIVVTFHSGESFLRLCLESLLQTTSFDVEIIVVINNTDEREFNVSFDSPRVRFIRIKQALGYAAAANAGAAEARGDYLIFTDHDIIFTPGWLEALCAIHLHSPLVGATSARIANPHSLRVLDFGIGFTQLNCPHPHLDQPLDSPLVTHSRRVQAMCCGGLTIERALFQRLGGFDCELGNFYTDIDLCLRLKALERECWVAADAVAYHFGGDFSQIDRGYKSSCLKSDIKALFRVKNDNRITDDMSQYYDQSWRHILSMGPAPAEEFVACCMLNVADPHWYVGIFRQYRRVLDVAVLPTGRRDSGMEGLYESLGYDFLKLRAPIAYFVDRFVSLADNLLWWQERADARDIVVDRNGNIMHAADIASRTGEV
jgi:glycosyltransferase involved in cell wall biosynthesis